MNDYGINKSNNTNKKMGRNAEQNIHDTEVLSAFEDIGKAKRRNKKDSKEDKIDMAQHYLEGFASMLNGMSPEEIKSFRFSASFKSSDGVSISFRTRYRG